MRFFIGVILCAALVGCATATRGDATATVMPAASETPAESSSLPPGGLTESEAIAAASQWMPDGGTVWATMAGSYGEVFGALAHRPFPEIQPPPARADQLERAVWGVQFRFSAEICDPVGTTCQARDALRTVLIDYNSGKQLRQSTYAPSPGDPLPTPGP